MIKKLWQRLRGKPMQVLPPSRQRPYQKSVPTFRAPALPDNPAVPVELDPHKRKVRP
jgi:hypothetical protein